jgi:CheY-like chemotaxis protein
MPEQANQKPRVWFVDDLPSNRERFEKNHKEAFDIRLFTKPAEVVHCLSQEQPDALLCDIFFYKNVKKAERIEAKVKQMASQLKAVAHDIGADTQKSLAGIKLIEEIGREHGGTPPFPVFAYTSKGPYILEQPAWDRIVNAGAKILLKGQFSPDAEEMMILSEIRRYRALREREGHGSSVFLVHGHDELNRRRLEDAIRKRWNLPVLILSGEPGQGRTLIEKFEEAAARASFAFVLLTPDDKVTEATGGYVQARPNVLFELGWFYGRLGRKRVCILFKAGTRIHSDLDGISRIKFEDSVLDKLHEIEEELLAAGFLRAKGAPNTPPTADG